MKKFLPICLVVIIFVMIISFNKDENSIVQLEKDPKVVSKPADEKEKSDLEVAVISRLTPLEPGVYAVFQNKKLNLTSDMEIKNYLDVVFEVSYDIFYIKALEKGIEPNSIKVLQVLKETQTEEEEVHNKAWIQLGITEEQYWKEFTENLKKYSVINQYLKQKIGEPSGAEYKKALNEFVKNTFLENQDDIQVNESLIKN